jgi:hypothetical protein
MNKTRKLCLLYSSCLRTGDMTKLVTVIFVLIVKKCRHEQKRDEIAESPCYKKH